VDKDAIDVQNYYSTSSEKGFVDIVPDIKEKKYYKKLQLQRMLGPRNSYKTAYAMVVLKK
jgi:hypothetical protein